MLHARVRTPVSERVSTSFYMGLSPRSSVHVEVSLQDALLKVIWSDLLLWFWDISHGWLHDCHTLAAIVLQTSRWRAIVSIQTTTGNG